MNLKKKLLMRKSLFPAQLMSEKEDVSNEEVSYHLAFFLGAGASIKAGVPDTFSFVDAFVNSLGEDQKGIVLNIISILNAWAEKQKQPKKVDIELLLEALQELVNKNQNILLPFVNKPELRLPDFNPDQLLKSLRDFIKSKVIVEAEAIKYLDPLRGFIQEVNSPLDIFSANYDTCIEVFCSENKLNYKDGFDEAWNPVVFDSPNIDIRLFKIHGSVTWYQSDRGRFLKIPVRTNESAVELITKERAEGLMLYPAQKFEYVEPLFELLMQMKARLDTCRILFVIGYSFRDDHVRRIFWDIARKNKEFQIVLIGPNAWATYQDRLKTYDDGKTLSSLAGKVICLPFLFEYIFPALRLEIFRNIEISRVRINEQLEAEIASYGTKWHECLVTTATPGDIEKLKLILDKLEVVKFDRFAYENAVTSISLGLFFAVSNQDKVMIAYFWEKFKEALSSYSDRLEISINAPASLITIQPTLQNSVYPRDIYDVFRKTFEQIEVRKHWLQDSKLVEGYLAVIKEMRDVLQLWSTGSISFSDYMTQRKLFSPELKENLRTLGGHTSTMWNGNEKAPAVSQDVKETEKREIQSILQKYDSRWH